MSEIEPMEIDITSENNFPPKPSEETNKQSINRSLISMALFIAAFYFIFKWDISYILILAGVILIHEIGHFLAMRIFKYSDLGIFFVPLIGAFASGKKDTISQKQNVIILLAGPLPGVVIGTVLYYFGLKEGNEFLQRTSNIFILINLFNLIPVMPLDGGRIIKSLFFENNELINKIFILLSVGVLTFYALYSQSYFFLIIPFFLLAQFSTISQVNKVKEALKGRPIDTNKSYNELSDEEYWLIRDEIGRNMKYYENFITPKQYVPAENEQKILRQIKSIVQKKPIEDLKIVGKIVVTLIWLMTIIVPFILVVIYYLQLGIAVQ